MSNNKPRRGSRGCVGLFLLALGAYFVSSIFTSRSPPVRRHHPRSRRDRRGETPVPSPLPLVPHHDEVKLAHRSAAALPPRISHRARPAPRLLSSQFSRAGEGIVLLPPNDDPRSDEEQWMISAFDAQTRGTRGRNRRLGGCGIFTWASSRPVAREARTDIAARRVHHHLGRFRRDPRRKTGGAYHDYKVTRSRGCWWRRRRGSGTGSNATKGPRRRCRSSRARTRRRREGRIPRLIIRYGRTGEWRGTAWGERNAPDERAAVVDENM